jgi:hypothetical protein
MADKPFLQYKGKPLVRQGNTMYYGMMNEPFVVMVQILSTRESNGVTVADKVSVQLISTDETMRPKDRIAKRSEKSSLYEALDIGSIWLERALRDAGK